MRGDFSDQHILDKSLEGVTDVVVLGGLVAILLPRNIQMNPHKLMTWE